VSFTQPEEVVREGFRIFGEVLGGIYHEM
jgi:hypothetical protein